MTIKDKLRVRGALLKHQQGKKEEARAQYEALYQDGVILAQYILPYSVMLLRSGEDGAYEKVREMLVKAQKAEDLTEERRQQLHMNYAISVWKLGDMDKAVAVLEASHRKQESSLTYQALGFLYVEQGDADKAIAYNQKALEYDDEDAIVLDNMGQAHYRLRGDKEAALPFFQKAHALKPGQIDTLYFLARYDAEAGRIGEARTKLDEALKGTFSPLNHATRAMVEEALRLLDSPVPASRLSGKQG